MERCYELYNNSDDIDTRRSAVELLRVVADGRVLPWIPRFLTDSDDSIQLWGAGIVDQLLWSNLLEFDECEDVLELMAEHPNDQVREKYFSIQSCLGFE